MALCGIVVALVSCDRRPRSPRNLLFISLDTTRKDHLPTYGYQRETAPRIDELARRSIVFDNATAQMTITNPSHASMFSGLYPRTHGVGENTRRLPQEIVSLTELLREIGLRTGGFASGQPLKAAITGLDQGFEVWDSEFRRRRDGAETTRRALEWLRGLGAQERYFLFVHLYDAHGPFRPSESYLQRFTSADRGPELRFIPVYQKTRDAEGVVLRRLADYVDRYDAMIRYCDDLVASMLDAVDLDETVVVIVADHGETLGERETALNLNHGTALFEEQTAIPLIIHVPGLEPRRVVEIVETVDLLPTLAEIFGVPVPPEVEGESLVSLMLGEGGTTGRALGFASNRARMPVLGEGAYRLQPGEFMHSVRERRWKLITLPGVEGRYVELYDLSADPLERNNVAEEHPQIRDRLLEVVDRWSAAGQAASAPEENLSAEDREELRALGYLDG